MDLRKVASYVDFSIDQARRRLNFLVKAGAIERTKVTEEKNRWDYGVDSAQALRRLAEMETYMKPTEALRSLAAEILGQAIERQLSADQLREALRKEREVSQVKDRTIERLTRAVQRIRANHLPVEKKGPWQKAWGFLKRVFSA